MAPSVGGQTFHFPWWSPSRQSLLVDGFLIETKTPSDESIFVALA